MNVTPNELNELLTERQVAELLGVRPQTLAVWRATRRYALRFVRIGRLVRYERSDVLAFLKSRESCPAQHTAPEPLDRRA